MSTISKPDPKTGLHILYLPVNQAFAVLWHDTLLALVNTRAEAEALIRYYSTPIP